MENFFGTLGQICYTPQPPPYCKTNFCDNPMDSFEFEFMGLFTLVRLVLY